MNLQARKIEIIKMVLETDNPEVLATIRELFLDETQEDFWKDLPLARQEEILQGIREIESGDVVDYEQLMQSHRK
jgi:O6-methylguanine-DNA--protein-cysteine methyltransferase